MAGLAGGPGVHYRGACLGGNLRLADFDASPAGEPSNSLEAQPQAGAVAFGVDVKVWFGGVS
jgi:hypothetical protein